MKDYCVIDCEISDKIEDMRVLDTPWELTFSCGVIWDSISKECKVFVDSKEFMNEILKYKNIVSFNGIKFDFGLFKKKYPILYKKIMAVNHIDILAWFYEKYGFRVSLNDFLKYNLDKQKSGNGDDVVNMDMNQRIFYCTNDVELTNELFLKCFNSGKIKYNDFRKGGITEVYIDGNWKMV